MNSVKPLTLAVALSLSTLLANSQDKQDNKLNASTGVITDFSAMKSTMPAKLFNLTEGIVIIPKMINAGLGVAGKRGAGIALIKQADGTWSNPVFVSLTGGSIGFQVGVQSVDLVLIFKNRQTLTSIRKNSFTLGGDVSVTAGPLGWNSTASTDAKLEAEIYSYSKTKGLFAGISLSGSVLAIDEKADHSFYGEKGSRAALFTDTCVESSAATSLKQTLTTLFR